jgi:hypothetical protein
MQNPSLFILEAPYVRARRLESAEPTLGSIALLDTVDGRPTTNEVKSKMDLVPWCPVCLLATPESGMRSVRRLPRTCVVFGLDDADGASSILKAVSSRPRPTASDLVDYLTHRTRLHGLSRLLSDLFTRPTFRKNEALLLPWSVREQLRQLGDWSALEWQRAGVLAELAADRSLLHRRLSATDSDARDAREWMDGLLGVTPDEFRERYGWEWVLEASLRRSGWEEGRVRKMRPLPNAVNVVPPREVWGEVAGPGEYPRVRATA